MRWVAEGTALCSGVLADLDDADLRAASHLPGWSRAHVIAHLAANAAALGNLVHWAATGEETPMYSSPEQRAADIDAGAVLPAGELRAWWTKEVAAFADSLGAMPENARGAMVRSARGRSIPATEIPWLRSREVMLHAVDLASSVQFTDLPVSFLRALEVDIRAQRTDVPEVTGALPDRVAWLAGRRPSGPVLREGIVVDPLPPWL